MPSSTTPTATSLTAHITDEEMRDRLQAELAAARLPVHEASSLPPACYTSPEIHALEVERLLSRGWLCVGRVDQVGDPGDYFTIDLLGEPLIVSRDHNDQIHAMSRLCRHRSMAIVESGAGNRNSFQCPYHLWTYSLAGQLLGAPGMQQAAGFRREGCKLPELRVEVWLGFIFVSFDPDVPPFAPRLRSLDGRFAAHRLPDLKTLPPLVYSVACNWKLFVENFIEFYHHAGTHPDTVERWAPTKLFKIDETDGPYTFNHADPGEIQTTDLPVINGLPLTARPRRHFGAIYPLHTFIVTSVGMFYFQILPEAVDRTTVRIYLCLPEETLRDPRNAEAIAQHTANIDIVTREDIATCETVQRGFRSRFARPGRVSHLELGVWRFNQYVLDGLLGAGA